MSTTPAAPPTPSESNISSSTSATTSTPTSSRPYVAAHRAGSTPNPCIECNRKVKFARLSDRAAQLGFDAVATGHHAQIGRRGDGYTLERGADRAKDQSYVVHMLGQGDLARTMFPIGSLTKDEVRRRAGAARVAHGDEARQSGRLLHHHVPVAVSGSSVGGSRSLRRASSTPAERCSAPSRPSSSITVGQRKGLGLPGGPKRYVVAVDHPAATVVVGDEGELLDDDARRRCSDMGRRSGRWRRAGPDERPRHAPSGRRPVDHDGLACRVAATATARRAGPERRAVRRRRPLCARRRHRRWRDPAAASTAACRPGGGDRRVKDYRPETYGERIADVYDGLFGEISDVGATVAFLDSLVPRRPSPILELAVGTGRLAIPLATLGHHVTGIDVSEEMLARLRAADVGRRVTTVHGDMVDDLPAGPFDIVFVAFNSLFMLADADRQRDVLRCRRQGACSRRGVRRRGVRAVGPTPRRIARRGAIDDRRPRRAQPPTSPTPRPKSSTDSSSTWSTASPFDCVRTSCDGLGRASSTTGRRRPGSDSPSASPTSSALRSPTNRRFTSASIDGPDPALSTLRDLDAPFPVALPSYPESQL